MGALELLGIIATFVIVLRWYVQNAEAGAEATVGLLAVAVDPLSLRAASERKSYSAKDRAGRRTYDVRDLDGVRAAGAATPRSTYRVLDETSERPRRAYRSLDDSRRQTAPGGGARYKQRTGSAAKARRMAAAAT